MSANSTLASRFAAAGFRPLREALAQEMEPLGVRVAVVEPDIIDTPMAHAIEALYGIWSVASIKTEG